MSYQLNVREKNNETEQTSSRAISAVGTVFALRAHVMEQLHSINCFLDDLNKIIISVPGSANSGKSCNGDANRVPTCRPALVHRNAFVLLKKEVGIYATGDTVNLSVTAD